MVTPDWRKRAQEWRAVAEELSAYLAGAPLPPDVWEREVVPLVEKVDAQGATEDAA